MGTTILRIILAVICVFSLITLMAWWLIAQPVIPLPPSRTVPTTIVDRMALTRHVYAIAGPLSPRNFGEIDNLENVGGYIATEWERAGLEPMQQIFLAGKEEYKNVIVELGPDTDEIIVVGAHYDAYGPFPGADDNASGVAGLIELAKLLKSVELKRRVTLVGYSLEEPPHYGTAEMGSAAHARAVKEAGKTVKAMISLEMIGYFSDQPHSQDSPMAALEYIYPTTGNFIALVSNLSNIALTRAVKKSMRSASSLPVHSINAPVAIPGIDHSDHRNYWAEGFPALMITDTAFYRNKNYHTANDIPESLDYKRMEMVVAGAFRAIVDLANKDR